ncbi:bifunctional riboflavin kinase/FAD synthetase [Chelatococcus asaccharovorans]|nr:bifunctional riboflavin kinase/FAD synthetase [Chelatococcus asaccharovorans]MBS7702242.1 bifunctional riboflavin kinase/FAD synthetase [Chelatococcus asaccharovorans]
MTHDTPFLMTRSSTLPAGLASPILAIGNFDGIHRGHQAVIRTAVELAKDRGRPASALTFDPHPSLFFAPQRPMFALTPLPLKKRLLAYFGLSGAIVLPFDHKLAATTAEDFVDRLLISEIGAAGIVIGGDFHFGKGREGSPDYLSKRAAHHGIPVIMVSAVGDGEENNMRVSSTAIREALARGDVGSANKMLGYRWLVSGTVIHGDKRGRLLGFPTANVHLWKDFGLRYGIYAVRVRHDDTVFDGVASFGRRPTFDNGPPLLEVHLFSFTGNLYDAVIDVEFVAWLRSEERFDDVDALVAQMHRDAEAARLRIVEADGAQRDGSIMSLIASLAAPDPTERLAVPSPYSA